MTFGSDLVMEQVQRALDALAAGRGVEGLECKHVDLKQEAGRRGRDGAPLVASARNETAAAHLAGAAACMANTAEGGALIVGVGDDGELLGTSLDSEWLRLRIYELTERRLTVEVAEVHVQDARLLVVRSPQAIEPIRHRGKIMWRVDDRCVEVDATSWHEQRMRRDRYDWSAQASGVRPDTVPPEVLALMRKYLLDSGEEHAADLAGATDLDMLRRLNAVTGEGFLTQAAALLLVRRPEPTLDYIRRSTSRGDSLRRIRDAGRSVLEEFARVEDAADLANEIRHVRRGFVVGQVRELPPRAVREAIINGLVHRDWQSPSVTLVEHVGRTLVVSSPGGFVGSVTPENIITHPSESRNQALAELCSALRLSEREGVGVDRMVADMVARGYPAPVISEIPGPYVRVALLGDGMDEAWMRFIGRLEPAHERTDVNVLLILRTLLTSRWIDASSAAPILQLSAGEAAGAIERLATTTIDDQPVLERIRGVPSGSPPAWRLSSAAAQVLAKEDAEESTPRPQPGRSAVARSWVRARGRISSTELGSILRVSPTNVSRLLQRLEEEGLVTPSRSNRAGRGFYYRLADGASDHEPQRRGQR